MPRNNNNRVSVERTMPMAVDSEKLILGCVLLDMADFALVASAGLTEDDFSLESHRRIWRAIQGLIERNENVDRVTVANELQSLGQLESVGGVSYLVSLDNSLPQIYNLDSYVRIVKDKAIKRRLIRTGNRWVQEAMLDEEMAPDLMSRAVNDLLELTSDLPKAGAVPIQEVVENFPGGIQSLIAGNASQQTGLRTGLVKMDNLTGGLHRGELTIIGARPSMGKTALATTIVQNVCQAALRAGSDAGPVLFSLEMSKESLVQRFLPSIARVDAQKLRLGYTNAEERRQLQAAAVEMLSWKFWIDDAGSADIADISAKLRKIRMQMPISLVVVDYLQLLTGTDSENRNLEIGTLTRGLKKLAKDLSVPFVVLSQLSRGTEKRSDQKPIMSDLRESGNIEQDADNIWLVHRDEYYKPDREDLRGYADIILAKQRNGPTDTVKMAFLRQYTRFENLAADLQDENQQWRSPISD